jgi:16S rRNA (cytidine1402-2'-O)-methyltransferase
LKEVDLIAAEDTRHSRHLLEHFGIEKQLVSYHQFNEAKRTVEFLEKMNRGLSVALISDAGMPGISDPGERLICACAREGIALEVIPGASAVLQALVAAGFSMTPFYFGGYLPVKSAGRQRELRKAGDRGFTSVYFESPHRFLRCLRDVQVVMPDRRICVARELTKKFEEVNRGTAEDLLRHYEGRAIKGEICIVIEGKRGKSEASQKQKEKDNHGV